MSPRHGRPRTFPGRTIALAAGAVTVVAGVGAGISLTDPGGSRTVAEPGAADGRAASSASPMAEEVASSAPPSPSGTSRGPAPARTKKNPSTTPSPKRTPERTAGESREAAGNSAPADRGTREPRTQAPAGTDNGVAGEILRLVNEERAQAGCPALSADPALDRAAQKYSDVMAANGRLSHTGPDGSTMTSRMEAEGYGWSAAGENIAQGQQNAEAVMDAWMNSEGHRANILNCSFKDLGVGVHQGDGGPWWVQDFGTKR